MYLNIKIKEDFRTLKKDTEYKFNFTNQDRYLIVGPNGCGKSTLINIIRSFQCDNASDSRQDKLGISNSDLDQIGAKSYNDVDRVLQTLVCPASPENDRVQDALTVEIGPEIIDKIIKRRSNSRFKREKSPIYISRERYE